MNGIFFIGTVEGKRVYSSAPGGAEHLRFLTPRLSLIPWPEIPVS
jgi:hypothetical protein